MTNNEKILIEALKTAVDFIKTLPEDCMGVDSDIGHCYQEEFLFKARQSIAQVEASDPKDGELLPCPFCGSLDLEKQHLEGTILHPAYRIRCDNCGASTGYTDNSCDEAWNTRKGKE